jgi:hypothetical protein
LSNETGSDKFGGEPAAALARRTPGVAGPIRRPGKRIGAAPAAFRPYRRPALIERRIAAVLAAVPRVDRAPASAGPRRLAPLRARPALGVSVGEQQSHYCDTEQNSTDRAHRSSPGPSLRSDLAAARPCPSSHREKNEEIVRLQRENVSAITGGDSFCWMILNVHDPAAGQVVSRILPVQRNPERARLIQ